MNPRVFSKGLLSAVAAMALVVGACSPEKTESEPPPVPSAVKSLAEARVGEPPAPAEGGALGVEEAVEEVAAPPGDPAPFGDDALLEGLAPEGWQQAGDIEHYGVNTLYTKVNGRSELYVAYDVVGLSWVSFVGDDDTGEFIDAFVYDMGSVTNAFGIYSVEREPDQPPVPLGREGYRTDANHYFWKGKHYAYVQVSSEEQAVQQAGYAVARGIADRLEDSGQGVVGLAGLPTQGLMEDTVQYFKVDALSLDFMTDTFTGRYRLGEDVVTVFTSDRKEQSEAKLAQERYVGYLVTYGENPERIVIDDVPVGLADLGGGFYDAVFCIGETVCGLSAVQGHEATLRAVEKLIQLMKARQDP